MQRGRPGGVLAQRAGWWKDYLLASVSNQTRLRRAWPGGVLAQRAGWWKDYLLASVSNQTRLRRAWPGGGPGCRSLSSCSPKKKVTKEEGRPGSPPRPRKLVRSPVLLDRPGGLRNSRQVIVLITLWACGVYGVAREN